MNQKNQGILYIIAAGFFFALMTLFVRLAGDLPVMQKAFFRNIVAVVFSFVMLLRSEEKLRIHRSSWPDLILRSICGTLGIICNFYAIDRINIADANILNKLSPFFAIIMSAIILKEKANKVEWMAVILAFIGALFVIKPSFQVEALYTFIGALGGLGAGMAYTYVRKLGKAGERGTIIVLFFSAFSCVVTFPFMVAGYVSMTWSQLASLMMAGLSATGGQLCITAAYTKAPAKEISVFDYTQVVFAALLGYVVLGQLPDAYSLVGYVIIIASAVGKWYYINKRDVVHN